MLAIARRAAQEPPRAAEKKEGSRMAPAPFLAANPDDFFSA
jgi:hypothetical protein